MDNSIKNIKRIMDDASFIEISSKYASDIHVGYGTINQKLVFCIAENGSSLNQPGVDKIISIYDKAIKMGAPIIYIIDNDGVDISNIKSMGLYGQILNKQSLASGVIPQIAVVSGKCLGFMSIVANACDFIFVSKQNGQMWTIPPISIQDNIDNSKSMPDSLKNLINIDGVYDDEELYNNVRELLDYLPSNYADNDSYDECDDDLNRLTSNFMNIDTIDAIKEIADYNKFFEIKKECGKSMFTGFIKLNGQTIAVVANVSKEKRVCNKGLRKARKIITFADSFSIPILTIVDATQFKADTDSDLNVAMPASKLVFSYVNATVPKVTLIKNQIGIPGFIMGSKNLDVDLVYAFKDSKI